MSYNLKEYNGITVCSVIKAARKNAGLSRLEMAALIGCSARSFASWEHGDREPSISVFMKILEIGGLPLDSAFNGEAKPIAEPRAKIIAQRYESLDDEGKLFVESVIIHEMRRMCNIVPGETANERGR